MVIKEDKCVVTPYFSVVYCVNALCLITVSVALHDLLMWCWLYTCCLPRYQKVYNKKVHRLYTIKSHTYSPTESSPGVTFGVNDIYSVVGLVATILTLLLRLTCIYANGAWGQCRSFITLLILVCISFGFHIKLLSC